MEYLNPAITVITLNVNGLNTPIKRQHLSHLITKVISNYTLPTRNPFKYEDMNRLKVKGWENICHSNTNQNKVGMAILRLNKVDVRAVFPGIKRVAS